MKTLKFIVCLALLLNLVGCAVTPAAFPADSIPASSRKEVVVLESPLTYKMSFDPAWGGIFPGRYVPEKENNEGIFYRGEGRPFFQKGLKGFYTDKKYALLTGGFWISKQAGVKPRIYFYVEAGYPSVEDLADLSSPTRSSTDMASSVSTNLTSAQLIRSPGISVGQGAIGGAISGAIISSAIHANVGKINYWPDVEDADFHKKLLDVWKKAQK